MAVGDCAVAVQGLSVSVPCQCRDPAVAVRGQQWGQQRGDSSEGTALEGNAGRATPGEHRDLSSAFATGTCSANLEKKHLHYLRKKILGGTW